MEIKYSTVTGSLRFRFLRTRRPMPLDCIENENEGNVNFRKNTHTHFTVLTTHSITGTAELITVV